MSSGSERNPLADKINAGARFHRRPGPADLTYIERADEWNTRFFRRRMRRRVPSLCTRLDFANGRHAHGVLSISFSVELSDAVNEHGDRPASLQVRRVVLA